MKKSPLLYPRPGSNRHSRKNRILNPARLPVPPLGPIQWDDKNRDFLVLKKGLA